MTLKNAQHDFLVEELYFFLTIRISDNLQLGECPNYAN